MSTTNKQLHSKILRDSSYPLYYSVDSNYKGAELLRSPMSKRQKQQNFYQ